jgi:hypothetical protein
VVTEEDEEDEEDEGQSVPALKFVVTAKLRAPYWPVEEERFDAAAALLDTLRLAYPQQPQQHAGAQGQRRTKLVVDFMSAFFESWTSFSLDLPLQLMGVRAGPHAARAPRHLCD